MQAARRRRRNPEQMNTRQGTRLRSQLYMKDVDARVVAVCKPNSNPSCRYAWGDLRILLHVGAHVFGKQPRQAGDTPRSAINRGSGSDS